MRLRSRTLIFNQKIILSIIRSTKLAHQLGISQFIDDLQLEEVEQLMQHCQIQIYKQETVIKQVRDGETPYCYFVVDGKVECTYLNGRKTQIIKHGNYFSNSAQCKWVVQEQSIIGKINYDIFRQIMLQFSAFFKKVEVVEKSLPFKSQNRSFIRYLLKFANTMRIRNGEYLRTNERVVFFLLDGYCDLEADRKQVARVANCIVGEQILFKQDYDYNIKVRSAYCEALYIPARILKIKLSNETLEKVKVSYETKQSRREKIQSPKVEEQDEQRDLLSYYLTRPLSRSRTKSRQSFRNKSQISDKSLSNPSTALTSRATKTIEEQPEEKTPAKPFSKQLNLSPEKHHSTINRSKTQLYLHSTIQASDLKKNKTFIILVPKDRLKNYLSSNEKKLESFGDFEENIKKRLSMLKRLNKGQLEQDVYDNRGDRERIEKRQWIKMQKRYGIINSKRKLVTMMTHLRGNESPAHIKYE